MEQTVATVEQIQGRMNQRQIPFKVSISPEGIMTFVPTRGSQAIQVVWDPALGASLVEVIDWLATYLPMDYS